ncbi:MAG TPA: glycoside hydrolase family 92 protein [Thermotogaceae bacterium]|nr:glycoside hydrolase family 92 protein [Thermotogaceae bacterium]
MKKGYLSFLLFVIFFLCVNFAGSIDPIRYVDPFIGTAEHGHTFPGACVPFGMVQPSPDTGTTGWDWCSGYHYSDESIMGFSQTHLSGTGAADYGEIMLMPIVGELKVIPGPKKNTWFGYRSKFKHYTEEAKPGYYSVYLDDYKIKVELTASKRVAFHRYTFPKSDKSYVLLDLFHRIGDASEKVDARIVGKDEIVGHITGGHFCGAAKPHTVYFVIKFSKPFEKFGAWRVFLPLPGRKEISVTKQPAGLYVGFKTEDGEQILVKIGISYVSIEGAKKNLEEIPDWDFDRVVKQAEEAWRRELLKIEIYSKDEKNLRKFYTALYHSFIHPSLFSDINGEYIGPDDRIYTSEYDHYTIFSIWDTFRALHPLFTIIQPEKNIDMIKSLLDIYEQGGWLPKWYKANRYTNCMIGTHADSVIADAIVKELKGFDLAKAYEALRKDAFEEDSGYYESRRGLTYYMKFGYIPADKVREATSKTLEFTYDDFCVAQVAKKLGFEDDYEILIERSRNYKNLFDPYTGFMRGKDSNGDFVSDGSNFDPTIAYNYYTEGNAWQWTFFAPHDVYGLINLFGSEREFERKLDELFSTSSEVKGPPDITGLIGQYAHGNEPSHHIPYLYVYIGKAWKTQKMVRYIMDNLYGDTPAGLCGNEDCGQMSAWFVFSALGFYPVCPGTPYYILGSPLFEKAVINLPNGKKFAILAENNSKKNIYVQKVYLNGEEINRAWITHEEILSGGTLKFIMGDEPNENFGKILPPNLYVSASF